MVKHGKVLPTQKNVSQLVLINYSDDQFSLRIHDKSYNVTYTQFLLVEGDDAQKKTKEVPKRISEQRFTQTQTPRVTNHHDYEIQHENYHD